MTACGSINPVPKTWPSGNLSATEKLVLPDLSSTGHGFTCTGFAFDSESNTFLAGDIGILQPNSGTIQSQIVRLSSNLEMIVNTIPVYQSFPDMGDIQGITIDASDHTIWFCAPSANKLFHTNADGDNLGSISVNKPTGLAYSSTDDSFWILNYSNEIIHLSKTGLVLESFSFAFSDALDQCFLDKSTGLLYITAGTNYTGRNNVYCFDTVSHHQSIACTVDSYSVEGIWLEADRMIILNDGYYHNACEPSNQANIYTKQP